MKVRAAVVMLGVCASVATCGAWTKHYSFSGSYPANSGVSSSSAAAVENGGASVTTSAKTQARVINAEKSIAGRVTKVVDGDTITVTPNVSPAGGARRVGCEGCGRGKKVRLRRIDAPESDQPGGDKATAFLKELIGGKDVEVRYVEYDSHGRVLGTVFFKGEKGLVDANLTMILNGWAWHYYSFKANDKFPAYDKAEQTARNAKVGLWADENPIRPYDWRKSHRK